MRASLCAFWLVPLFATIVLAMDAAPACAEMDIKLTIEGISDAPRNLGEIPLLTFGQSLVRLSSAVDVGSIVVSKRMDSSSGALASDAADRVHRRKATITMSTTANPTEFYAMTMEDVMIDSISVGIDSEGVPMENVTISFTKMSWTFYSVAIGEQAARPPGLTFIRRKPTGAPSQKPGAAVAAKPVAAAVAAPPPPAATTFNSSIASLMRTRTRGQGTLILGKLDGVVGTSAQPGHLQEVEFSSLQWATSTSGKSGDPGFTITPGNITVTKRCDKATLTLLTLCLTGKPIPKAVFMFVEPGAAPVEKMRMTLINARVDSLSTNAGKDQDMAEMLSFSYDSVQLEQSSGGHKWTASWGKSNIPRK